MLDLNGDGKGQREGGGADHWSDKHYLHCLEFLETCLECQRILFCWLGGNSAEAWFYWTHACHHFAPIYQLIIWRHNDTCQHAVCWPHWSNRLHTLKKTNCWADFALAAQMCYLPLPLLLVVLIYLLISKILQKKTWWFTQLLCMLSSQCGATRFSSINLFAIVICISGQQKKRPRPRMLLRRHRR